MTPKNLTALSHESERVLSYYKIANDPDWKEENATETRKRDKETER